MPDLGSTQGASSAIMGVLGGNQQRVADLGASEKGLEQQLSSISQDTTGALGTLESKAEGMRPPKLDLPPPPVAKSTDPMHVWGSAAMMLAAIGSMMTRQPLTTAMNAAAGVLTGFHQKDQEAANQAFKTWEAATKNAMEIAKFQEDEYKEALAGITRREGMVERQGAAAEREAIAAFTAKAHAFQDETAVQEATVRGIEGITALMDRRARLRDELEKSALDLPRRRAEADAFMSLEKSPDFQAALKNDPMKALAMFYHVKSAAGTDTRGDGTPQDLTAARGVYGEVLKGYPKDSSGNHIGAPNFDDWYANDWPVWGEHAAEGAAGYSGTNKNVQSMYGSRALAVHNMDTYRAKVGGNPQPDDPNWQRMNADLDAIDADIGRLPSSLRAPADASYVDRFFQKFGWSPVATAGIIANAEAESGLNPNPEGSNDSGKAYGMFQWHGDRQQDFKNWAGHDIRQSTLDEQLEFANFELTQGKYANVGAALREAKTPQEAGAIVSRLFESPKGGQAEADARGAAAGHVKTAAQGGKPGVVPVPPALKGDPDGTKYHKGGMVYVKQGNQLVPQG